MAPRPYDRFESLVADAIDRLQPEFQKLLEKTPGHKLAHHLGCEEGWVRGLGL